ncbi:MAG TPA: autotransporter-associated beta strand repeat-containing protein, partial [Rhizomicrobium sp.]|nr:autotransporter-associated beta strand repeat-containing protein [Rhizomicrobium sp.]
MSAAHWKVGADGELFADAIGDPANVVNSTPPTTADQWKIGLDGDWDTAANWTNGVPTSSSDVTIAAFGTYMVTLSAAGVADSLTLNDVGATFSESASGSLNIVGDFEVDAGTAILNGNNTIGDDFRVNGGTLVLNGANSVAGATSVTGELEVGNSGALGVKLLGLQDGILLGTVTETLANHLVFLDSDTIAAAHAKVLTLSEGGWFFNGNQLTFGLPGNDGTVVWDSNSNASTGGSFPILIQDGTLKGGDDNFDLLFQFASSTTVAGGATLDLAGASITLENLEGDGIVTSSAGAPILTIESDGSTVSASIRGSISVDIALVPHVGAGSLFLTGTNIYSGTTTIEDEASLFVGDGGTGGTLGRGSVDLVGTGSELTFDRSDTVTIANAILGVGRVGYEGGGTYVVKQDNSYTGDTAIVGDSIFETATSGAFGSGTLILENGEFLATASFSIVNGLDIESTDTIAARHGKVLTLALSNNWVVGVDGARVIIGDGTNDGTVLWKGGSGGTFDDSSATLEIRSGTFKDGDGTLGNFVSNFQSVTVDAGANLVLTSGAFLGDLSGT